MSEELLEEFEDEIKPAKPVAVADEASEREWSGRSSKIALADGVNVYRDGQFVTGGSACIDCAKSSRVDKSHAFHARASKDPATKRWVGPEASHLADLTGQGAIRGTVQAIRRAEEIRERALTLGIEPESRCRACREPIPFDETGQLAATCPKCSARNGLPELRPQTLAEVKRQWGRQPRDCPADRERAAPL